MEVGGQEWRIAVPTIFAANESSVLVNGESVEGVRAVDYRRLHNRASVYALGSAERIGMISGPQVVQGRLRVASTSPSLDALMPDAQFQITAQLRHGETRLTVAFDECFLIEKTFDLEVGGH